MSWFIELIGTMKVPAQSIEKEMKEIMIAESQSEMIDREGVITGFWAFIGPNSIGMHP
jgi:hypothetical protein